MARCRAAIHVVPSRSDYLNFSGIRRFHPAPPYYPAVALLRDLHLLCSAGFLQRRVDFSDLALRRGCAMARLSTTGEGQGGRPVFSGTVTRRWFSIR